MRSITISAAITIVLAACSSATTPAPSGDDTPPTLSGRRVFPADNTWNKDISNEPVDPSSDALISTCGSNASLHPDFGTTWLGDPLDFPM